MLGIIIAVLVLSLSFLIFKLCKQQYTKEGIAIIGNIPFLGCAIQLQRRGGKFLGEMRKKHGDIFLVRAGVQRIYMVFNEDFYSQFYKGTEEEMAFYKGIRDKGSIFVDITGERKLQSEVEDKEVVFLKPLRNFLQEGALTLIQTHFFPNFDFFLKYVKTRQNFAVDAKSFTLELLDLSLFIAVGLSACTFSGFEVASSKKFLELVPDFDKSSHQIMSKPRKFTKRARELCNNTRYKMREVIDSFLVDYEKSGKEEGFPHILFNTHYETSGRKFGVDEAGFVVLGLTFAAMGNSSAGLANTIVEILVHPEVHERVKAELNEIVVNDPRNKDVKDGNYYMDQEMINKLEYLQCCMSETVRLSAPPIHLRKIQHDLLSEKGTVLIPKDSFVAISPYVRQREENVFENACTFDPSRFAKPNKHKRFSFISFGQGRHFCPGKQFAESLIKLSIAKLFLTHDLRLVKDVTSSCLQDPNVIWFGSGILRPALPILVEFTSKF